MVAIAPVLLVNPVTKTKANVGSIWSFSLLNWHHHLLATARE